MKLRVSLIFYKICSIQYKHKGEISKKDTKAIPFGPDGYTNSLQMSGSPVEVMGISTIVDVRIQISLYLADCGLGRLLIVLFGSILASCRPRSVILANNKASACFYNILDY